MDAILFRENTLLLLDQTLLPTQEVWRTYTDYRGVAHAIQTMVVRGAPAIGVAVSYAVFLAGSEFSHLPFAQFKERMDEASRLLASTRPTALNLFWALQRMHSVWSSLSSPAEAPARLRAEAIAIHQEDVQMNQMIGKFGSEVVPEHARILTHCNAGALATGGYGTALGVIRAAAEQGKVEMVYCDETRPLLQGARLTAYELCHDQIPATLICDNMAASLMAAGKVDLVILGCDRMAANGDFANKIGTYGVAVLAHHHGIPFYTALPSSTIDLSLKTGAEIAIEERSAEEVRTLQGVPTAPCTIPVWNPAFDVTPHQLLTGIITDKGVLYPPFDVHLAALFG